MGYGEVAGNESVHWTMVHEVDGVPQTEVNGRDGIKFKQIGIKKRRGKVRREHPGQFRVSLRYADEAVARQALASARVVYDKQIGMWVVALDVPAIARKAAAMDPVTPAPEVRVDW